MLRFVREVENKKEGHARRARVEGHACHARRSGMDHPTYGSGPDKRVPPRCNGRDKRVPPSPLKLQKRRRHGDNSSLATSPPAAVIDRVIDFDRDPDGDGQAGTSLQAATAARRCPHSHVVSVIIPAGRSSDST